MSKRIKPSKASRDNEGSTDDLMRWAKTAELPTPLRWGEIEDRIMLEPGPTPEETDELKRFYPQRGPLRRILRAAWVALVLLPVMPFVLPAVFGLGFTVAYIVFDREVPYGWEIVPKLLFGGAILIAVFPVFECLSTRRRDPFFTGLTAVTTLASAGSAFLLRTAEPYTLSIWPLLQWLAIIAAGAGVITLIILFTLGKPPPRTRLGERFRTISLEERWIRAKRAVVLEQLRKRQIVHDADSSSLMELPVGTWHELESLPDGRVVRRL